MEEIKQGELSRLLGLEVIESKLLVSDKRIYIINPEALSITYPYKNLDLETKEEEEDERIGWTIHETVGMGVVNPRSTTAIVGEGSTFVSEAEHLTEEEKLERKFLRKGW